jgi:hypothetical protein
MKTAKLARSCRIDDGKNFAQPSLLQCSRGKLQPTPYRAYNRLVINLEWSFLQAGECQAECPAKTKSGS